MVESKLKEIEIIIDIRRGEYFTRDEFIKKMGIEELFDETNLYEKSRFFGEIISILKKMNAVKEVGDTKKGDKKGKGRKLKVYKAIRDITLKWVISS